MHGASAGGGSVAYHLAAYGGRDDGLFVGAVPQSPFFPTSRTVEESEFQFDRFVSDTGCSDASNSLACLRSLPLSTIQSYNVPLPLTDSTGKPNHYFLPVVDGDFSEEHMYKQFSEGRFIKVPTLIGGDTNEGDTFAKDNETDTQDGANAFLQKNWPNLTDDDVSAINDAFPNTPREKHAGYFGQAADVYGNMTFACGGLLMSAAVAEHLGADKSWNYRYNL
ncbi:carboxylesterase family protein, partial [Candidatus Bathyarchaeota archaeon]|nr:carboxylesterase family protein [Candidatus Bathyarchaeota archaeon]